MKIYTTTVDHCGDCPNFYRGDVPLCRASLNDFGGWCEVNIYRLPAWCPLPDAPAKESQPEVPHA